MCAKVNVGNVRARGHHQVQSVSSRCSVTEERANNDGRVFSAREWDNKLHVHSSLSAAVITRHVKWTL